VVPVGGREVERLKERCAAAGVLCGVEHRAFSNSFACATCFAFSAFTATQKRANSNRVVIENFRSLKMRRDLLSVNPADSRTDRTLSQY
jgi:hypothetical protein